MRSTFGARPMGVALARLSQPWWCGVWAAILAFTVTAPYWTSGYLLLLDDVAGPRQDWPLSADGLTQVRLLSGLPWWVAKALAAHIGLGAASQKLAYTAAIFMAAWGAGRLVRRAHSAGWLYAATLYAVNPWVYDRFSAGQGTLILAYALLPMFLQALLDTLARPKFHRAIALALLAAALGVFDAHLLYLLPIIALLACLWRFSRARQSWPMLLAAGSLVAGLEAYWLLPATLSHPLIGISDPQLAVFATRPDPHFGLIFNTTALHGFWRETMVGKPSLWWLFFLAIAGLAVVGAFSLLNVPRRRWRAGFYCSLFVFGLFVALGTGFGPTAGAFHFLFLHLPGFAGFREPQKALALVVLAYSYLGANGLNMMASWIGRRWPSQWWPRQVTSVLAVTIVLVYGHRELWGQWGAIRPGDYPDSWYRTAAYLASLPEPSAFTLVLPWELYQPFDFSGQQVIANPAPFVFPGKLLIPDTTAIAGVTLRSPNPLSAQVPTLLSRGPSTTNLGHMLAELNVRHILVLQPQDTSYGFLHFQGDLRLVRRWPDLALYEVTAPIHAEAGAGPPWPVQRLSASVAIGGCLSVVSLLAAAAAAGGSVRPSLTRARWTLGTIRAMWHGLTPNGLGAGLPALAARLRHEQAPRIVGCALLVSAAIFLTTRQLTWAFWAGWAVGSAGQILSLRLSIGLASISFLSSLVLLRIYQVGWLSYHPNLAYSLAVAGVVNVGEAASSLSSVAYGFLSSATLGLTVAMYRTSRPMSQGGTR